MKNFVKCIAPIVVMLSLIAASMAFPFPSEEDSSSEGQEVPILKPGPYESYESTEDEWFDLPVEEGNTQGDEDLEELYNDSGFHNEQGNNRPDGARKARRQRRSPQDDEDDEGNDYDEGEWDWSWPESDEYDDGYESEDEGTEDDYETPTYSSEEEEFEYEDGQIDNGEFENEEEIGTDEDGALLRLMHNSA